MYSLLFRINPFIHIHLHICDMFLQVSYFDNTDKYICRWSFIIASCEIWMKFFTCNLQDDLIIDAWQISC